MSGADASAPVVSFSVANPLRQTMPAKVLVRDLRKQYDGVPAAQGVDLTIEDGEIFGLLGPNGAGKTTTLECVIGLREPDEGEIEVCGIDARRRPREVKQKIGAALQTTSLQDKITPTEALRLFGSFYRDSVPPETLIERFSLKGKADAPVDSLSGGQRQRLALALAFVNNPELVFLDEPTAGLDPQARRALHGEIGRMKQDGHTVLLTTHYIDEAEQLCDRIAIIANGQIVATGAPRELIARSRATQSVTFVTDPPVDEHMLASLHGIEELVCIRGEVSFRTGTVIETLAELTRLLGSQGVELTELRVRKATLEDLFIELTGSRFEE